MHHAGPDEQKVRLEFPGERANGPFQTCGGESPHELLPPGPRHDAPLGELGVVECSFALQQRGQGHRSRADHQRQHLAVDDFVRTTNEVRERASGQAVVQGEAEPQFLSDLQVRGMMLRLHVDHSALQVEGNARDVSQGILQVGKSTSGRPFIYFLAEKSKG